MSGFACIVHWRGPAPDRRELDPLLAVLDHRGGDGRTITSGSAAVTGVLHRWTTPEDQDSDQPIRCGNPSLQLIFDGRIDNRAQLLADLDLAQWASVSDAELIARGFDRWGARVMERLVGPGVLAVIDHQNRRVTLGRDGLGDRTIVYAEIAGGLVVASEERAILAHPEVPPVRDEVSEARYLAVSAPEPGRTFFSRIREVPPGCVASIDNHGVTIDRHWCPEELVPDLTIPDREWIDRFRSTLAEAVRCRLRGTADPSVLMSGGLDSTSVAAHAATALGSDHRLHTISWIFDELEQADERKFITPMIDRFNLDATLITGDHLWPMSDREFRPSNPNMPLEAIYRPLTQAAYAAAAARGTKILLNGEMGDQLFANHDEWLRHLLGAGRFAETARRIRRTIGRLGIRRAAAVLRPALGRTTGIRRVRSACRSWMTPAGNALISKDRSRITRAQRKVARITDPFTTFGFAREVGTAAAMGVEIRRPYRDRRLVELMLRTPSHLFVRDGLYKWLLREAGRGLLPEKVRLRRQHSSLLPLCARGLGRRENATVRALLGNRDAVWRPHVRGDWLEAHLAAGFPEDSVRSVAVWHCLMLDLWRRDGASGSVRHTDPDTQRSLNLSYNSASENDYEKSA